MTDQLNEVFDSESIYPTTNLTPKAKVPQIIHIQAPGTNDIVVRLTSSDTIGTRVKAVKPGDKVVQVFLTSMSEKGNITDFKGGLGSDPIGAINTIFDTVIDICKEYRIEAILFRFPKSKMKGKDHVAQRIIQRLTKTRSGGRYTTLDEVEGLSKKFAFSLLYRKGKVLQDVPGIPNIDPAKFEKVDTKVGETYVNVETGQSVSKSEAIAQTVVDAASKTTTQQALAITKVSRQAALTMQGFHRKEPESNMQLKYVRKLNELVMDPPLIPGDETPSPFLDINKPIVTSLPGTVDNVPDIPSGSRLPWHYVGRYGMYATIVNSYLDEGMNIKAAHTEYKKIESELDGIVSKITFKNAYQVIESVIQHISSQTAFQAQDNKRKYELLRNAMSRLYDHTVHPMAEQFLKTSPNAELLDKSQKTAIKQYTGTAYKDINSFLLGAEEPTTGTLNQIAHLDAAISNGITLPDGVLLYRGQRIPYSNLTTLMENKYFTFRNYVSTSVIPRIFLGGLFGVESFTTLDADSTRSFDNTEPSEFVTPSLSDFNKDQLERIGITNIDIGLVIKGAHKIKTLNTAGISSHVTEAEIILPRGLITRISNVYASDVNDTENTNLLIELDIVPPSELTEAVEVYDGDLFLETGEVKSIKGVSLFSEMYYKPRTETKTIMAGLIGLNALPEKFVI